MPNPHPDEGGGERFCASNTHVARDRRPNCASGAAACVSRNRWGLAMLCLALDASKNSAQAASLKTM